VTPENFGELFGKTTTGFMNGTAGKTTSVFTGFSTAIA
jgi:hypothetical protein